MRKHWRSLGMHIQIFRLPGTSKNFQASNFLKVLNTWKEVYNGPVFRRQNNASNSFQSRGTFIDYECLCFNASTCNHTFSLSHLTIWWSCLHMLPYHLLNACCLRHQTHMQKFKKYPAAIRQPRLIFDPINILDLFCGVKPTSSFHIKLRPAFLSQFPSALLCRVASPHDLAAKLCPQVSREQRHLPNEGRQFPVLHKQLGGHTVRGSIPDWQIMEPS